MTRLMCPTCAQPFGCGDGHVEAHDCPSCWYGRLTREAEERFKPLVDALHHALEVPVEVIQTGGMIFCAEVSIGPRGEDGSGKYALFSDWAMLSDEDGAGFGIYETINVEPWVSHDEWHFRPDIAYIPANAEKIAEWAAPIILRAAGAAA